MKREVQLFISDTRVDLFKDETISITDTIQNVSDISKIFTPFSKQFNLPASQTNNKVFKHYYNFDIQDGFDARFTVSARIEINHAPFKNGKLRLSGVTMKNNLPHTYKVVFFGEPNDIKDIFADEDLSSLNSLSTYDISYSNNDFQDAFTHGLQSTTVDATNTSNRNIVVPLISLNTYFTYDSGTNRLDNVNFTDLRKQLKPAIKVKRIIEAIETQYSVNFNMTDLHSDSLILAENDDQITDEQGNELVTEDASAEFQSFFGSDVFDELYLWLHRESSPVTEPEDTTETFGVDITTRSIKLGFSNFTYVTGGSGDTLTANKLVVNKGETFGIRLILDPNQTNNTGEIIVKDKTTNELLFYRDSVPFNSGSNLSAPIVDLTSGELDSRTYDLEFRINCQIDVTFAALNPALVITKDSTTQFQYSNSGFSLGSNIFIQDYLPQMKVIDFLTGLFKMFNLVAYKKSIQSETIRDAFVDTIMVQTFDDFMTQGVSRDITEYVNINQSNIDRPIPYNQVNFEFSPAVTQTSIRFRNQFAQTFGDLKYSAPEKYDGKSFDQIVPFERSVLINLIDSSGNVTNNILGWWVDDSGQTTLGAPFLFFNRLISNTTYPITASNFTTYNAASSVRVDSTGTGTHTLNFNAEFDEFAREVNTNSLFIRFYQQYIVQTFNKNTRIVKVKAKLPVSFILNYSVNDTIVIGDQSYYINSIKINLNSGDSDLDLIVKKQSYTNSVLT